MKRIVSDVKSKKLAQELKDLETRDDDELKDRWHSLYGTKPPQKIHRSLLIAAVAHRMQEKALGTLKSSVRRHLMQAANNPATPRPSPHYPSVRPRAGTVLVRDWGGVTHQAKVLEDGALPNEGNGYFGIFRGDAQGEANVQTVTQEDSTLIGPFGALNYNFC